SWAQNPCQPVTHTRWKCDAAYLSNQWEAKARDCGLFLLWAIYSDLLARHGAKELKRKRHVLPVSRQRANLYRSDHPRGRPPENFSFRYRPLRRLLRPGRPLPAWPPAVG